MKRTTAILRWFSRLTLLGTAGFLAAGGVGPVWLAKIVPSLSPLATLSTALAQRTWYFGAFWLIGPAILLLSGAWGGKVFCRWACPVGTLVSVASRVPIRKTFLRRRIHGYLFWIVLGSSLAGFSLFLSLDPLAMFPRFVAVVCGVYLGLSLVPGLLLPIVLVLCAVQPMVWCSHICPLGYALERLRLPGRVKRPAVFLPTRRHLLAGLAFGVPAALLARWSVRSRRGQGDAPILPPGAENAEQFAAACVRCYACTAACPTRILRPVGPAGRSAAQWFQPEVVFSPAAGPEEGYCLETCTRCSAVCPTAALRPLSLRQKRQRKIASAEVIRDACLAWADGRHCMVCQEFCPYRAIETDESPAGLPRPVIREDTCRGCGLCYHVCPARRKGKAIRIRGGNEQTEIHDGYADLFAETDGRE